MVKTRWMNFEGVRKNTMDNILDIYDDKHRVIFSQIEKEYEVPDFVKSANIISSDQERNQKKILASNVLNRYPIDNEADIWLSKVYLDKAASNGKLDSDLVNAIKSEIEKTATFLGKKVEVKKIPAVKKEAKITYELELKDFALAIPNKNFADDFNQKYASFMYRDNHFCLYPINTPQNIKLANLNFPKGLDDDLYIFRGAVAKKLASLIPISERNPQIEKYLPMDKKTASYQIQIRAGLFPESSKEYERCSEYFDQPIKLASILEELDIKNNFVNEYPDYIIPGREFIRGIEEPELNYVEEQPVLIDLQNKKVPFSQIKAASNKLLAVFPNMKDVLEDPSKIASYLKNNLPQFNQIIMEIINE